jgi:hypothetical protein
MAIAPRSFLKNWMQREVLLLSFLASGCFLSANQIAMYVSHADAHSSETRSSIEVFQDEPFMLTVSIKAEKGVGVISKPTIVGLENFVTGTASNGVGYCQEGEKIIPAYDFHYYLEPKSCGQFKIGPVICEIDGKEYEGNSVQILVTKTEKLKDFFAVAKVVKEPADNDSEAFKLFVGQRAWLVLKIYMKSSCFDYIDGLDIKRPETADIEIGDAAMAALQFDEYRSGKLFKVIQTQYPIVALKPGFLEILPFAVSYNVMKRNRGMGFASMFFGSSVPVTLHTNDGTPLGVEVCQIPDNVQAIGSNFEVSLTVEKTKVMLGEPVTLTFDILGSGDFDKILHPELELPPKLRSYEAKAEYVAVSQKDKTAGFGQHKRFYYTLQASRSGVYKIPAQDFCYFDTAQEAMATKKTGPVSFYVMGEAGNYESESQESSENGGEPARQKNEAERKDQLEKLQVIGLYENYEGKVKSNRGASWLLIFLFLASVAGCFFWQEGLVWLEFKARKKMAYLKALRALNKAAKTANLMAVYHIFLEYFAARMNVAKEVIDFDWIKNLLEQILLIKPKSQEFLEFFHQAAGLAFGKDSHDFGTVERDAFFKKAKSWFDLIEKQQKVADRAK